MLLQIEEQESEGLLEGGTATEVATYLIISAAQVKGASTIAFAAAAATAALGRHICCTWLLLQLLQQQRHVYALPPAAAASLPVKARCKAHARQAHALHSPTSAAAALLGLRCFKLFFQQSRLQQTHRIIR